MNPNYYLYEVHGYNNIYKDKRFGIEVEVEGHNLPREDVRGVWRVTKDGSLRGEAREYVLAKPMKLEDTLEAILYLQDLLADSRLNMSFRTSVHVHVNVMSLRLSQLKKFIYTSFLLENLLVAFSGEDRIGNRFCLRVRDAETQLNYIKMIMKSPTQIPRFANEEAKYAAINLVTLRSYGSVEFRSMQGTTDPQAISNWVQMLNKIYDFAVKDVRSCKELSEYAAESPEDFLQEVMQAFSPFLQFFGYTEAIKEAEELLFFTTFDEAVYAPVEDKKNMPKAEDAVRRAAQAYQIVLDDLDPFEPREQFADDMREEEEERQAW